MSLRDWFQKYHNRPLKVAAVFLLAGWFVFAAKSYLGIAEKHEEIVRQTADLLSLTIQSKDRTMAESLIEAIVSQSDAKSAALCQGETQIIGANQSFSDCKKSGKFFEKVLESGIPGSGDLILNAKFDMLDSLSHVFKVLGLGLVLVISGFYFIRIAQSRIEKDILGPLLSKLLSDEKIEITELNDLRDGVKRAQELEAQKAVTLAVQENNRQVAHDVRSPIASINELLGLVELKDQELNSALKVAIARANSVANDLLNQERRSSAVETESAYSDSSVIEDMAIEKRPLFAGGVIELSVPKNVYVRSKLSRSSLARVLSNIIDNAMLACERSGHVKLSMRQQGNSIVISVVDTGRGMSAEMLEKIGQKGFSVRKASEPAGSGRGVYSSKMVLEEVGGNITFESAQNQGTTVLISLPIQPPVRLDGDTDMILVDDNESVRFIWEFKASRRGMKLKAFNSAEDLLASSEGIPKRIPIFLDSDLGQGKTGQSFAPILKEMGFEKIHLTTGYRDLHGAKIDGIDSVIEKSCDDAIAVAKPVQLEPAKCREVASQRKSGLTVQPRQNQLA